MSDKQTDRILIRISPSLKKAVKREAVKRRWSAAEYIRAVLEHAVSADAAKSAVLALAFLLMASQASAQSLSQISYATYTSASLADSVTTARALSQGAHESNPLLGQSTGRIVATKAAISAGFLLMARYLETHKHPKLATSLRFVGSGTQFAAAAHNAQVIR